MLVGSEVLHGHMSKPGGTRTRAQECLRATNVAACIKLLRFPEVLSFLTCSDQVWCALPRCGEITRQPHLITFLPPLTSRASKVCFADQAPASELLITTVSLLSTTGL